MQRYYTKKERIYRKYKNNTDEYEEYAEKCIYEKYSKKTINILHYANKLMVYNINSKYITVINKMLSIDSKIGYNNINEIYYDLFDKNIEEDYDDVNLIKINYDYNINISNDNLKKLLIIRNEEYNWILKFFVNDDILIIIPVMINIADRFFSFIFENNYQDKLPKIEHINKIFLIACLLLSMAFKYVDIPKIKHFYSFFNINISYANFKMYIQYAVAIIINKLNFDIYRPYHDNKLTKEIMNDDDMFLKYKHNLHKKISLLIHSEKINLTPKDYFE